MHLISVHWVKFGQRIHGLLHIKYFLLFFLFLGLTLAWNILLIGLFLRNRINIQLFLLLLFFMVFLILYILLNYVLYVFKDKMLVKRVNDVVFRRLPERNRLATWWTTALS